MAEIDLAAIKRRSVAGIVALTSRTLFLQLINFASMFLLTVFLAPQVFGIYHVVMAMVNFLNYFSDIGLAAALIQKKEKLTEKDLKTTFTIQQGLVIFLVVFALLLSARLTAWYRLSEAGVWLFRSLVVGFFFSSLKTIPSVILERKLDFNRLILPQIGETLLFNLVAVILAWQGKGVASFTWAVLVRGVSGLILIYLLVPWRPGLAFHRPSARKLLSFGVPFQFNSLLALVKDDLLTVFLGKVLSFTQLGFIAWGQKWAKMPLHFIMGSINKVTFSAYSRLQDNLIALQLGVEHSLFAVCSLTFPALMGLALLGSSLVSFLPRYLKWQPALLTLYLFCLQASLACISTTLTNVLNATGRIKTTLKLMILWTTLAWILTPVLIHFWDFNGVALAAVLVATTVFLPLRLVSSIVSLDLKNTVFKPFVATLSMGLVLYLLIPILIKNLAGVGLAIIFGAIIYSLTMLIIAKKEIAQALNLLLDSVKK